MLLKYLLLFWMFAFHLFSNAQNWMLKDPNGPGYIYSLDITPDSSIWATFYYNKTGLYHSNDYGKNWNLDTQINCLLTEITFYNEVYGLTGGFESTASQPGKIFFTEDSGQNWAESILPNNTYKITSIQYVDSSTAYAFTELGKVICNSNFARFWSNYHSFSPYSLIFDSHVFGIDHMLVASDYLYLKTKDNSWDTVFFQPTYDIDFINDSVGFAYTDSVIIKTTNSGKNWTILSKNVMNYDFQIYFLELGSINALSEKEIYICLENEVFRSVDSGKTWQEDYLLDTNQFITSLHQFGNDIWMSGNLGLIRKRNSTLINIPELKSIKDTPHFYPNPFYSKIESKKAFDEVKIYNQSGLVVYQEKRKNINVIDLSSLPNGIYIITGISDNTSFHQKLIKS